MLPENIEAFGVVLPANITERMLSEDINDPDLAQHICPVEEAEPLCGADVPDPEVFPFRGRRQLIRAGAEDRCPECVAHLTSIARNERDD